MAIEDVTIIPTREENAAWDAEKRRALHDLATGQARRIVHSVGISGFLGRVKFLLGERMQEMDFQGYSDAKVVLQMAIEDFSEYAEEKEDEEE
jgi:hypothetical protein